MSYKIPLYVPLIEKEEIAAVTDAVTSGWVSSRGKYVSQFEDEFAKYVGRKYALSACNGTVALHLALEAMQLPKGTAVLCPTLTYVATANAIRYAGLIPLFVDCDESGLSNQAQFDKGLEYAFEHDIKVSAVMPVHLYGYQAKYCFDNDITKIPVVEDCAESFGTTVDGNRRSGTHGDISCFSFFGNKTITTGEGGMVLTDNEKLYNQMYMLRGVGQKPNSPQRYHHLIVGYNYRMTNLAAALGVAQLKKANNIIEKKKTIQSAYKSRLESIWDEIKLDHPQNCNPNFWMVTIGMKNFAMREGLMLCLESKGIETRPAFLPIHSMVHLGKSYRVDDVSTAEDISARYLNLPSWPGLNVNDIDYICNCILDFYKKY